MRLAAEKQKKPFRYRRNMPGRAAPGGGPGAAALAAVVLAVARWRDRRARYLALTAAAVGLALVGLPYGVAFKLVTVSGVVTLPAAAYAFGRLAGTTFAPRRASSLAMANPIPVPPPVMTAFFPANVSCGSMARLYHRQKRRPR